MKENKEDITSLLKSSRILENNFISVSRRREAVSEKLASEGTKIVKPEWERTEKKEEKKGVPKV